MMRPRATPVLKRIKGAGHEVGFKGPLANRGLAAGFVVLVLVILVPIVHPAWTQAMARVSTLAALVFLLATPGLAMKMGPRAFVVAAAIAFGIYLVSAGTSLAFPVRDNDLLVVGVILSFFIFALAGFNLLFVVEEMVFDAHRLLRGRGRIALGVPVALTATLSLLLPYFQLRYGVSFPAFWSACIGSTVLLGAFWLVRMFGNWPAAHTILRELHLFVFGVLLATGTADGIQYFKHAASFVPSLVAYLVLVGTWLYVSYTTLQRTHFLLRGRDALPWVSLLLAASFAIMVHVQTLYGQEGEAAVEDLVTIRLNYMVVGIWVGIFFYGGRSLWKSMGALRSAPDARPSTRAAAGRAQKVAATVVVTERLVESATRHLYSEIDKLLPGSRQPPVKRDDRER